MKLLLLNTLDAMPTTTPQDTRPPNTTPHKTPSLRWYEGGREGEKEGGRERGREGGREGKAGREGKCSFRVNVPQATAAAFPTTNARIYRATSRQHVLCKCTITSQNVQKRLPDILRLVWCTELSFFSRYCSSSCFFPLSYRAVCAPKKITIPCRGLIAWAAQLNYCSVLEHV